jgi:hypothetical protein
VTRSGPPTRPGRGVSGGVLGDCGVLTQGGPGPLPATCPEGRRAVLHTGTRPSCATPGAATRHGHNKAPHRSAARHAGFR